MLKCPMLDIGACATRADDVGSYGGDRFGLSSLISMDGKLDQLGACAITGSSCKAASAVETPERGLGGSLLRRCIFSVVFNCQSSHLRGGPWYEGSAYRVGPRLTAEELFL